MLDKDTIISLANEAGIKGPAPARQGFKMYASPQRLMNFAALVAAHEREACAYRANVALFGADRGLANRVNHAIRNGT